MLFFGQEEPLVVEADFLEEEAALWSRRNAVAERYQQTHVVNPEVAAQLSKELGELAIRIKAISDTWWREGGGQMFDSIAMTRCQNMLDEVAERMLVRANLKDSVQK